MRLIDADALDEIVLDLNANKGFEITRGEYKLIDSVLFEFPTIEERKKGRWMKWEAQNGLTNGSECSECGYITSAVSNYGTKFCPNCGADMRGGKGEQDETD